MTENVSAECCVVGGGPAGMMLGFLLARSGVRVTVLEKHKDFLRDFRGDTVHPSTLQILSEIGLYERFDQLKQHKAHELSIAFGNTIQPFVELRGLKPFDYIALVPQWDFLDLIASAGRDYPNFDLRMSTKATGVIEENGRVVGVRAESNSGDIEIRANLVVATDGRHSTLRDAAGFTPIEYGAPMDVLWFRVPRKPDDPEDVLGRVSRGHMMVMINRGDYWQCAFVVPKGENDKLRAKPIESFREEVGNVAPIIRDRTNAIASWDDVKFLEVKVNRLPTWHKPGLLMIGDAAHAMSPVGGVGINLAVQDAVAAANVLAPALRGGGKPDERTLARVQARREFPTKFTQGLQRQIQNRVVSRALASTSDITQLPALLRFLLKFRFIRHIPARLIGYGIRREHVHIPKMPP
ncbi:MAG TPA: FAD-dependent oxidoreductase [Rudaea sp.]|nr:FAD-dependent oxidoreductase [Rudaea sp.]